MEQLTHRDLRSLTTTLQRLYGQTDLEAFPAHAVSSLAHIIAADVRGYNEVNFRRRRLVAITDPVDALDPRDEELASHHLHEQPLFTAYQRTKDGRAAAMSDFLTTRQFHRLTLYNEMYRRRNTEDLMAIFLPTPSASTILFTFSRSQRSFSERDRQKLNILRLHLIQAYNNAEVATRLRQEAALLKQAFNESHSGIIVLTPEGRIQSITDQAGHWLRTYFGKTWKESPHALPELLHRWVRCQLHVRQRRDEIPHPQTPFIATSEDGQLIVRLLSPYDTGQSLLILEEHPCSVLPMLRTFSGFTPRETDILNWLSQGKTNKEIATLLALSPNSIRSRLEEIYKKLGVSTRTAAVRRFLEIQRT